MIQANNNEICLCRDLFIYLSFSFFYQSVETELHCKINAIKLKFRLHGALLLVNIPFKVDGMFFQ